MIGFYRFSGLYQRLIGASKNQFLRHRFGSWNQDVVGYNESVKLFQITDCDNNEMTFIFHPLLALIASVTDRELAKYIQFLKEENKILRGDDITTRHDLLSQPDSLSQPGFQ